MIRYLSIIICIATNISYSQVNIETYRSQTETGEFLNAQSINLTSSLSKSISSYYIVGIKYHKNVKINDSFHGFFISKVGYGKRESTEYINKSFHHLRFIATNKTYGFYPEFYTQYESDVFGSTETRVLGGIGSRYKFQSLTMGTGFLSEWYQESESSSKTQTWRLSQYMNHNWAINAINSLNTTFYIQPSIQQISDIRYYLESTFTSKITPTIAYTSTLSSTYFSESSSYDEPEFHFESGLSFNI